MRRSLLPLWLLAVLAFGSGLGRGAIADSDEAFYAESSREMVESGDWLTPYFNYEPRFQKPPLYYWLTGSTYLTLGVSEFSARLWSGLSALGLVLVTAVCARRWFDESTGLMAGAITATSFGYYAVARMALPDLPLAFFITLAIWSALAATLDPGRHARRWLLLAAAASALGFLMKGPLAVAIPGLVIVPTLLVERRSLVIRATDLLAATLLFVVIAAPWYLAMWWEHGPAHAYGFFVGDNYERFATARFNDPRPWWFYLPVLAGGLLPWTPLTMVWVGPLVRVLQRRNGVSVIDVRLLLWALLPLVFFTMSVGKQPRYILPVLPPLAILLAHAVVERVNEWRSREGVRVRARPNHVVVAGAALGGACLVTLAVALTRLSPIFHGLPALWVAVVPIAIGLVGGSVVVVALTPHWRIAPWLLAVAAATSYALLPFGTLSASQDSTVYQVASLVRQHRGADEAVGTYRVLVRNLVFYSHVKHTDLIHDDHVIEWISRHPRALLVMRSADADRLAQERGARFDRLAEWTYFNEAGLRARTVLAPDPAQDLDHVVLVRAP
ncbi:MAG: ArnT family glycosyltransferase [Acidobacteriota bacterium]